MLGNSLRRVLRGSDDLLAPLWSPYTLIFSILRILFSFIPLFQDCKTTRKQAVCKHCFSAVEGLSNTFLLFIYALGNSLAFGHSTLVFGVDRSRDCGICKLDSTSGKIPL
jgi:hypothetical protein